MSILMHGCRQGFRALLSVAAALGLSGEALAISSSNSGIDVFTGININTLLGADAFYNAGYTGTRAIQANIEALHPWTGHQTLEHLTVKITGTGALGTTGDHATSVAHAMGGRNSQSDYPADYAVFGIGYGATLWSGAIATSVNSRQGTFKITDASLASVYSTILQTGSGGNTADIFNSSWGYEGDITGTSNYVVGVDALIKNNGKVGVVSAGNSGPATNTVSSLPAGYNTIAVGSVASDTNNPAYQTISSFSSRGPSDFYNAGTGTTISSVRATVDIVAPGENLTLAAYDRKPQPNEYWSNQAGTSFSSPLVAGGTALIVDAGRALYAGNYAGINAAVDGRVVKAVLLNGADKLPGWTNGQSEAGGVIQTTQSLDWAQGAGRMNLAATFDQFVSISAGGMAGTTDVAGLGGGNLGSVSAIGWDFGQLTRQTENLYFIDHQLLGGSDFTASLSWFVVRNAGDLANFSGYAEQRFSNLDLRIFHFDNLTDRTILGTTAQSVSLYNNVEHLHFVLPEDGYYGLGVNYAGDLWNFVGLSTEQYGLSWNATAILDTSILGDLNNDGVVNNQDIAAFVLALTDPTAYAATYPTVNLLAVGDINGDHLFDNQDIAAFTTLLTSGGSLLSLGEMGAMNSIPEPASLMLLAIGGLTLLGFRRNRERCRD